MEGALESPAPKRRRIIEEEEEDENNGNDNESVGSNPDDRLGSEPSDEEEGEDLMENWLTDYAPAPELDQYDEEILGDENISESYEDIIRYRRSAEAYLDEQDARRRLREREVEDNLEAIDDIGDREMDEDIDFDEEEGEGAERSINLEAFECPLREWIAEDRTRREIQRRFRKFLVSYYPGIEEVAKFMKMHEGEDPIPPLPRELRVSHPIYPRKIREMCSRNNSSLEMSYRHLVESQSLLAMWLTDIPREMFQLFDEVLKSVVLQYFPRYAEIHPEVHIRIVDLTLVDRLRDLRQSDLNCLIRVAGVITRRTSVFPVLQVPAYSCGHCGHKMGGLGGSMAGFAHPISSSTHGNQTNPQPAAGAASPAATSVASKYLMGSNNPLLHTMPIQCPSCQSSGPFPLDGSRSIYGNFQKLTLQESPGTVPPGRVPRYKEVYLRSDLIDQARPGEEIELTGIFCHSPSFYGGSGGRRSVGGFPVFSTILEANALVKKNAAAQFSLSEEEKRKIRELSKDSQIRERLIRSIAPSIYGHRHIKTAVALSLFGGCGKEGGAQGMHRVRGDINVLLLGDPGTAKSQMLKYCEKIAPRAVYTTGKGASAVGLTAGVHRDPLTREWTLEGGALVLADQGVCLIDEFDKMNEQDRTSIHEAMEQQTISVSKAGIVTSLQARCSVVAAANPIGGTYDPSLAFSENVELTDPILQRFDILCVLQDTVDPISDERLATFVVNSHRKSHPEHNANEKEQTESRDEHEKVDATLQTLLGKSMTDPNNTREDNAHLDEEFEDGPAPLEQSLLKKYIAYARAFVRPVLHDLDSERIATLYADLRRQSAVTGGIPIAVRHIESVVRMAEASARMCLRDHVREDDIDLAIKVMLDSFLQSQKFSVRKVLQRSFRKYITFGEETNQLLMHKLRELMADADKYKQIRRIFTEKTEIFIDELESRAREFNIFDLKPFFASKLFKSHGMTVDYEKRIIVKSYE